MNMKALFCTFFIAVLATELARGQGTLIFDQQSSTNSEQAAGGAIIQQIATPYGQSFTPSLSAIQFIQLAFFDFNDGNGSGATVFVNLRSGAVNGAILAQTASVFMPDGFGRTGLNAAVTNFFFSEAIAVTPGDTYYFQPVVQSGDSWGLSAGEYMYPGGNTFAGGNPLPGSDYWFREGIFAVPEPSATWMFLVGLGLVLLRLRRQRVT